MNLPPFAKFFYTHLPIGADLVDFVAQHDEGKVVRVRWASLQEGSKKLQKRLDKHFTAALDQHEHTEAVQQWTSGSKVAPRRVRCVCDTVAPYLD